MRSSGFFGCGVQLEGGEVVVGVYAEVACYPHGFLSCRCKFVLKPRVNEARKLVSELHATFASNFRSFQCDPGTQP